MEGNLRLVRTVESHLLATAEVIQLAAFHITIVPCAIQSILGESLPGQGIKRNRPWDSKPQDTSWKDRF